MNEVKENELEIALTISKVPSKEDTEENETCADCDDQGYSDEVHCTELKNRTHVKFYYSDDEDDEELEVEEEEEEEEGDKDIIMELEAQLESRPEEETVDVN